MTLNEQLQLSYYEELSAINETHKVYLVQHRETRKIYVKKILDIYNRQVYEYLRFHPIPNTPHIYEVMENENQLIVIEEYISGVSMEEYINNGTLFSSEYTIEYIDKLCEILQGFHTANPPIIHRDIKPSNIILTSDGNLYLLDFNAAKYVNSDEEKDTRLIGTPGYAAPEQYGFGSSNIQTDIYALGILMQTMLTGNPSTKATGSNPLSNIIKKCTRLEPTKRFASVSDLQRALHNPLNTTDSLLPPGYRTRNIRKMIFATIAYLLVFCLSFTLEPQNVNGPFLYVERLCCLIMFLGCIAIANNYLGIQQHLALCTSKNHRIKHIGIILWCILFVFIIFILLTLTEVTFFPDLIPQS